MAFDSATVDKSAFLASEAYLDLLDWPRRCACRRPRQSLNKKRKMRLYVASRVQRRASCPLCYDAVPCPYAELCKWNNELIVDREFDDERLIRSLHATNERPFVILACLVDRRMGSRGPRSRFQEETAKFLAVLLASSCCDDGDEEAKSYIAALFGEILWLPPYDPLYFDVVKRTMTLFSSKDAILSRIDAMAFESESDGAQVWRWTESDPETICDDPADVDALEAMPSELFESEGASVFFAVWSNPEPRPKKPRNLRQ